MIATQQSKVSVVLVTGIVDQSLVTEHLGTVWAIDPETHDLISPGMPLRMSRALKNYYLVDRSGCFPKWAGFRRMAKAELFESYQRWLNSRSAEGSGESQGI